MSNPSIIYQAPQVSCRIDKHGLFNIFLYTGGKKIASRFFSSKLATAFKGVVTLIACSLNCGNWDKLGQKLKTQAGVCIRLSNRSSQGKTQVTVTALFRLGHVKLKDPQGRVHLWRAVINNDIWLGRELTSVTSVLNKHSTQTNYIS